MRTMTGATVAALVFGLGLATTPVFAADNNGRDRNDQATDQQDQSDQGNDKDRGRHKGQHKDDTAPAPYGQTKTDNNNANDNDRLRSNRTNTDYNNNDRDRSRDRDGDRDRTNNNNGYNNNNWNDNNRDRYRDRNRTNFNINIYRRDLRSPRRYRMDNWRAPRGYYYRRWHHGNRLPIVFWRSREYWLLDYIAFGLFAPPPGYVWVRYGPDALLIDTYTGEIVQVRYDVFYS